MIIANPIYDVVFKYLLEDVEIARELLSTILGEPEVVHIDQELDYRKTFLARDFASFVSGLVNEETFQT